MSGRQANMAANIESGPVVAEWLRFHIWCGRKIAGKRLARKQRHGRRTGHAQRASPAKPFENLDICSQGGPPSAQQIRIVIAAKEPPQARAPHAGWMTVQAGLLTRGSMPLSAFPGPKAQWHDGERLSAYSCGRSCGFGSGIEKSLTAFPCCRSVDRPPERRHDGGRVRDVNAAGGLARLESIHAERFGYLLHVDGRSQAR